MKNNCCLLLTIHWLTQSGNRLTQSDDWFTDSDDWLTKSENWLRHTVVVYIVLILTGQTNKQTHNNRDLII